MKKFLCICVVLAGLLFVTHRASAETKQKVSHGISMASVAGVGMFGKNSGRDAAVFNDLSKEYPNSVIAKHYIRMEAYLVNGKTEYEFFHRLLGTEAPTEQKLNDTDAFKLTDIGIFLSKESTTVAGISELFTFPNPLALPDELGALQTTHLESIYNGKFVAKVGDTTYIPGMYVGDCRVVNTAQQSHATNNRSEKHPGDGFIPQTPQYLLLGRENNSLKLVVPADSAQKVASAFGTTGYKTKVVCILRGFIITGAGNQRSKA